VPTIIRTEYLEIDGVAFALPSWEIVDLTPLWSSAKVRGEDRRIPGAAGARRYRRRRDITTRSLPMVIDGRQDQDGNPVADARSGLRAHIDYLEANVVAPTNVGDGSRTAVLHRVGGNLTGPVHVLGLELGTMGPSGLRAVLELSIPGGKLL
jgi:hypothetical protein